MKLADVGLHMNLVNWLLIFGESKTCSWVHPFRNCEYGLLTECLWFFAAAMSLFFGK